MATSQKKIRRKSQNDNILISKVDLQDIITGLVPESQGDNGTESCPMGITENMVIAMQDFKDVAPVLKEILPDLKEIAGIKNKGKKLVSKAVWGIFIAGFLAIFITGFLEKGKDVLQWIFRP